MVCAVHTDETAASYNLDFAVLSSLNALLIASRASSMADASSMVGGTWTSASNLPSTAFSTRVRTVRRRVLLFAMSAHAVAPHDDETHPDRVFGSLEAAMPPSVAIVPTSARADSPCRQPAGFGWPTTARTGPDVLVDGLEDLAQLGLLRLLRRRPRDQREWDVTFQLVGQSDDAGLGDEVVGGEDLFEEGRADAVACDVDLGRARQCHARGDMRGEVTDDVVLPAEDRDVAAVRTDEPGVARVEVAAPLVRPDPSGSSGGRRTLPCLRTD